MNNFANHYFHLTKCSAAVVVFCCYVLFICSSSICVAENQQTTSDLFNAFIDGLTLFSGESLVPNSADHQNQTKEELQRLQQWISNIAAEFVITYDLFEDKYLCQPLTDDQINGINLGSAISSHFKMSDRQKKTLGQVFKAVEKSEQKKQFLQLLFSFGAILGAQMGATAKCEGGNCIGQLLNAFECADHYTMLGETELREYEQIIADDFGDGTAAGENAGKGNVYAHYDDAIQINWSPLRVVIEQMDKINKKLRKIGQKKSKEKQLAEYLESSEFQLALQMSEKFTEIFPMAKQLKEKTIKIDEFMGALTNIQQNLEENLQRNEHLFNLITVIVRNFGGIFFKIGEVHQIEIGFDGAHKMLQKLYDLAIKRLVREKGGDNDKQFECIGNEMDNFEAAIGELTDGNTAQSAKLLQYMAKFVPKSETSSHLLNLFFTFATRLEAFLYGKRSGDANREGEADRQVEEAEAEEKVEKPRHRIGAFIAATQCVGISAEKLGGSIFDSPIKMAKTTSIEEKHTPLFGIVIEKPSAEAEKQWTKTACKNNFKMLKQLAENKFSIYDGIKLIRKFDQQIESHHINMEIPAEVIALAEQIDREQNYLIGWHNYSKHIYEEIQKCQNARFLQKIWAQFMKKLRKIGIDPKEQMGSRDLSIGETIQRTIKLYCEAYKGSNIEEQVDISLLQSVGYDLVMNFEFDPWREMRDRAADLLRNWTNFFLLYLNTKEEEEKMYETSFFLPVNNELFDIILNLDNGRAVAKPINLPEMEKIAKEGLEVIMDLQYLAHTGETRKRKGQTKKSAKGKDTLEKEVKWHKEKVAHFVEKKMPETLEQMVRFYGTKLNKD
ncbi:hypothetical protein niasHT_024605 [Heterodera trifolii]|uniref:Secreted protein n=1 Tax=Heterodera trifolii TaxID=157864 RepID=A0ABD2K7G7_9BILA